MSRFFASRLGVIAAGAVIGVLAALLQKWGNPGNMGVCVACFERDIAGALGLHRASVVQYLRPEIIGFVLGSLLAALACTEFKARTGSAPIVRFVLGMFAMIGALVFLGCPWRALFRLAGGDLNAVLGLAGLILGVSIGVWFLKNGYTLGRSRPTHTAVGWFLPAIMIGLLLLAIFAPTFSEGGAILSSESGPGSMHAPLIVSLFAGLVIGILAQRTRFCTMGSIRDVILMGDTHLISGAGGLLAAAFATNLILGQFNLGVAGQPVAHDNHLWNFLGMVLAGLAFALAGGCPGRQLFLAGEGDADAGVFVLGMITGAAFSHNFGLASSPKGPGAFGPEAVFVGLAVCLVVGFVMREKRE
ncbi:MAG: YedE family putative selenium transporter [Anaerolineae bacterium]